MVAFVAVETGTEKQNSQSNCKNQQIARSPNAFYLRLTRCWSHRCRLNNVIVCDWKKKILIRHNFVEKGFLLTKFIQSVHMIQYSQTIDSENPLDVSFPSADVEVNVTLNSNTSPVVVVSINGGNVAGPLPHNGL